jgi:hypothetical protein
MVAVSQFSNMIVLSNAYLHPHVRPLILEGQFVYSLLRTIWLLELLSPISLVFRKKAELVRYAYDDIREHLQQPFVAGSLVQGR